MTDLERDPTRWFVFEYPEGYNRIFMESEFIERSFDSFAHDPYKQPIRNQADTGQNPFEVIIKEYCLRYFFFSEQQPNKSMNWKHTPIEMTELNVNRAFMSRALEYYGSKELTDFLDFHFNKFHSIEPNEWLNYVEQVFADAADNYVDGATPVMKMIKFTKQANDWIAEKRKELAELELTECKNCIFEKECIDTIQNMYGVNYETNLEQFYFYTQNVAMFEDQKFDWIRGLANEGNKLTETEKYIFIALCLPTYERYLENIEIELKDSVFKAIEGTKQSYSNYLSTYDRSNPYRAYFVLCKEFQNLLYSKLGIANTPPTPQTVEVEKVDSEEVIDPVIFKKLSHRLV